MRARIASGARGRTLDLGAGTGRNLPAMSHVESVVAVDIEAGALRRARARRPAAHVIVASAEALPFANASFDTVVSGLVFCSISRPDVALGEVARVLRGDGRLRMFEHVRAESRLGAMLQDFVQPAWTWAAGGCRPNRDTEATLARNGWRAEFRRARNLMRELVLAPPSS